MIGLCALSLYFGSVLVEVEQVQIFSMEIFLIDTYAFTVIIKMWDMFLLEHSGGKSIQEKTQLTTTSNNTVITNLLQ